MSKFIPYLSEATIERDAAALLAEYTQARSVVIVPPIPIEDIVEKHLNLGIEFDDTHRLFGIPRDPECCADILGAIFFDEARIVIDESLDPEENSAKEGRYRFTLAHEGGGHWRLHRLLFANDLAQAALFGGPQAPAVVCRSSQAKERIEWQADFYASCLLMPRKLVLDAWRIQFGTPDPIVYESVKDMQVARRPHWNGPRIIGEVIRDLCEPKHTYLFDHVARAFGPKFGVSAQAMRIRLEKLGLLLREVAPQRALADL